MMMHGLVNVKDTVNFCIGDYYINLSREPKSY